MFNAQIFYKGVFATIRPDELNRISFIIEDKKINKKFFRIVAKEGSFDMKYNIASFENLDKKSIKMLLLDKEQEVVKRVLTNRDISEKITYKMLKRVIKRDIPSINVEVVELLKFVDVKNSNKLIKKLKKLDCDEVNMTLEKMNFLKDKIRKVKNLNGGKRWIFDNFIFKIYQHNEEK